MSADTVPAAEGYGAVTSTRRPNLSSSDLSYLDGWEPIPGLDMGRRYIHAPITEAILEFHVDTSEDLRLADLATPNFGDHYQPAAPVYKFESELQIVDGSVNSETRDQSGFSFNADDESRTIVTSTRAFTFIWRNDYTHWGEFIGEAETAWTTFREVAKPTLVRSIGVRFVNQIAMPNRPVEIKDYLRTSVDIPAYLPQAVSSLFMQVDIPLATYNAVATITSAMLPAEAEKPGGALLLDIDVKAAIENGDPSASGFDELITTTLDKLRLAKNYVFEACITDATRGLIN